jgi:tRNA A37 threonylcarbamoyladenosine modification protein TsaB
LVVTDARRREIYWARYRDAVRIDGPAVSAPADVDPGLAQSVAGSPDHAALFGLPCREPLYPTAAGLVAAVVDWSQPPAALVPLYLRRPDAKTIAERDDDAGRNGPRRSRAKGSSQAASR